MILYDDVCTPCVRKQPFRDLRKFAIKHKLPLRRVDISKSREIREAAEQYGIDVPFVVNGKVALKLGEPLEKLL